LLVYARPVLYRWVGAGVRAARAHQNFNLELEPHKNDEALQHKLHILKQNFADPYRVNDSKCRDQQ
jgi:hypothetical protein